MQRIVKRTFVVGGALALLCAGLAGCGGGKAQSWTFTDEQGSIRKLSDYQGQVLVLGDHRGNSRDGRWFGFVPEAELYGRAEGVFWRAGEGPGWHDL